MEGKETPLWKALLLERRLPWRYKNLKLIKSFEYYALRIKFILKNFNKEFRLIRKKINIDLINPYDKNHLNDYIDKEHKRGIELIKKEIIKGKHVFPILIRDFKINSEPTYCGYEFNKKKNLPLNYKYQRLDGFKRYIAYKQAGFKKVECILDNNSFPGGQHKMNWLEKSKRKSEFEYAFIQELGKDILKYR